MALIRLDTWIYFYIKLENANIFFKIYLPNHAHLCTTWYSLPHMQGFGEAFCENYSFVLPKTTVMFSSWFSVSFDMTEKLSFNF